MWWCVQLGKSSRSGEGWLEVLAATVTPCEEAGERNNTTCGEQFRVMGRGIAWDRHCEVGVPLFAVGLVGKKGGCRFLPSGIVREPVTSTARWASSVQLMAEA